MTAAPAGPAGPVRGGRLEVEAPAKVNLFLRVLGRRPDGFHQLETLVAPLELADVVRIEVASGPPPVRLGAVTGEPALVRGVPLDSTNLVVRAAEELARAAAAGPPVRISLDKRVPAAAGLGGGSSDAAATLLGLNELWGLGLDRSELAAIGARVGSDVPALVAGRPVIARGRGESLEPADGIASRRVALVTFDFGVSTPEAFAWWDEDGGVTGPDPAAVANFNDLEGPVMRRHPAVRRARDRLVEAGARLALMSGSGPSVFGIMPGDEPGSWALDPGLARELERISGRPPIPTRLRATELGPRDSNADLRDQNPASLPIGLGPTGQPR